MDTALQRVIELFQTGETANIKLGLALAKSQKIDLTGFLSEIAPIFRTMFKNKSANPNAAKMLEKTMSMRELHWPEARIPEAVRYLHQISEVVLFREVENLEALANLPNLERFFYNHHRFTAIPEAVFALRQVRVLALFSNDLVDLDPRLADLPNLQELHLDYNHLSVLPDSLFRCIGLRSLALTHNRIEVLPDAINRLVALENLYLGANPMKRLPEALMGCKALKIIRLVHNSLEEVPYFLLDMPNLVEIGLSRFYAGHQGWERFVALAKAHPQAKIVYY